MRIATLQFAPSLAPNALAANFSRAESLLMREERAGTLTNLDLLVLPELAFTGYNHPSLAAIAPYLEPTADGPSTRWAIRTAKRLGCTVAVGYPEAASPEGVDSETNGDGEYEHGEANDRDASNQGNYNTAYDTKITASPSTIAYNSLVFVDHTGSIVAHHRKSHLYYTDTTWARESPTHTFTTGVVPIGSANSQRHIKLAAGICMDINPYNFTAPWTAYEFANFARQKKARLVVVSMAWLTRLSALEVLEGQREMDGDAVGYWIERFRPLEEGAEETVVVCANRTGEEGRAELVGDVRYAGSSLVMGMGKGETRVWDVLGSGEDGLLIVDTERPAKFGVKRRAAEEVVETGAGVEGMGQPVMEMRVEAS